MAAMLKMAAIRALGPVLAQGWRRGWASGRKAGGAAGVVVARAPPTPVAAAPELLFERTATRLFVLVHVAALSQAMFWSSLTYMAWAFWQEPKTLGAAAPADTAEPVMRVDSAETGARDGSAVETGKRDDLSKLRALAPDRTRYQAMAVFATVGALFVGAIELFAFRNVRRLVLQDGKLLVRTFALLPAWQNFALPASSAYVAEALQGMRARHGAGHGGWPGQGTDGGKGRARTVARVGHGRWTGRHGQGLDGGPDSRCVGKVVCGAGRAGATATRTPFVLLRVRDKKWTYLLDKSGSFPKPARFDALFVRAPSS